MTAAAYVGQAVVGSSRAGPGLSRPQRLLVTASEDRTFKLWDLTEASELPVFVVLCLVCVGVLVCVCRRRSPCRRRPRPSSTF